MKNLLLNEKVQKAVEIFFTVFGIYILYQILRKMLGGSWKIEEVILGLIVLTLGFVFGLAMLYAQLKTEMRHLRSECYGLTVDVKELRNEFFEFREEMRIESKSVRKDLLDFQKEIALLAQSIKASAK